MATYSLSGSGTQALTASTTGLEVTITTPSTIGGLGRSNPTARYDQGLIRFSDGTGYWAPVAILGGPQFIPVPANATSLGYALLGGAVVSVVEVIGGTVFFSATAGVSNPTEVNGSGSGSPVVGTAAYVDIASITLTTGNWLVWGKAVILTGATGTSPFARIWDGTTEWDLAQFTQQVTSGEVVITLGPVKVTVSGSTVFKLQAKNQTSAGSADGAHSRIAALQVA